MTSRRFSTFALACLIAIGAVFFASPARAEDGAKDREIKVVKKKIQALEAAAERAQDAGRQEEANELAARARDLTHKLEAVHARRAKTAKRAATAKKRQQQQKQRDKQRKGAHPEKTIHKLAQAIEALKALGGHEDLIHGLANTIEQIKRREHGKRGRRRGLDDDDDDDEGEEDDDDEGEDEERAGLRRRVEILRMAMPALREGEKRNLMEIIERAIHTGELLLEGREDAEARKIYERTPSFPELAEVLHMAAKLWQKFGNKEKAAAVMRLSRHYAERAKDREVEEREEHDERERHERREHEEREHHGERERAERRGAELEEMRKHLHHLREQLARLARHLEKISREK